MTEREQRVPAAVIFDFDGVIVDTEPLHWEAFRRMLEPAGVRLSWEAYLEKYLGFDDRDVFRVVYRDAGRVLTEEELPRLMEEKAEVFEALVRETSPSAYPGVVELIRTLAGRVPLALCSGALRRDITPILRRLGILELFDVLVTADDVHASKPDPASYVLAVDRLRQKHAHREIEAARCLAVEDTPAGITAAQQAGVRVLALPNTYPREQLGGAGAVFDTLANVGIEDLGRLIG